MSDKRSNLIDVGRIAGAFGVKGWLKVMSDTEPADNIVNYSPWWLKTPHGVKPFKLLEYKHGSNGLLVRLEGVDGRDQAAEYRMTKIAIDQSQLVALHAGDYYWHQLIGLNVVSEYKGQRAYFGRVKEMLETGANDVLVVDPAEREDSEGHHHKEKPESIDPQSVPMVQIQSKQRLIPYVPDTYVLSIDLQRGEMVVNWDPDF